MKTYILAAALSVASLSGSVASAQFSNIGLPQLRAEVGQSNVDGTGVSALHIEAEAFPNGAAAGPHYGADPTNAQFTAKTFVDPAGDNNAGQNAHADSVASEFYGSTFGVATGLGESGSPPITIGGASGWIFDDLGANFVGDTNRDQAPIIQNYNVSNHSYTGFSSTNFPESDLVNALQRADWLINQADMTMVVPVGNGSGSSLPELFAQSYNVITVGREDGNHSTGLTTVNGAGRSAIHLVSPRRNGALSQFTSIATPVVSGAAAVLHQTGSGVANATNSEVIKATLLAGATKEEFADWDQTATRRLDDVYGAGELNVYNSYHIQQGGEFNGATGDPATAVGENGWDFETGLGVGEDRFYEIEVEDGFALDELSVILNWNAVVEDTNAASDIFIPSLSVADLSLSLFNSTNGFLDALVELSDSPVDNVEHLYLTGLEAGTYHLRVSNNSTGSIDTDFALAFRSSFSAVPEPSSLLFVCLAIGAASIRRNRYSQVD